MNICREGIEAVHLFEAHAIPDDPNSGRASKFQRLKQTSLALKAEDGKKRESWTAEQIGGNNPLTDRNL
jgi:hypothetical protein